ncbi:MAG: hypothetical protein J6D09_08970 [Clostridia bacterium]|nr:hypothetical protein [Clostridia bacterium]MBP3369808.1 hypothetical protein [Clostridia bacterium]
MAKKKDKPQIINNIKELNLEIDYDKLADAIVKAQEKSKLKAHYSKEYSPSAFSKLTLSVLRIVSVLCWVAVACVFIAIYDTAESYSWNGTRHLIIFILSCAILFGLFFLIASFSHLLWKAAKEIEKEKDKNYVMSVFSGVVGFVALVVALIALFKGVR